MNNIIYIVGLVVIVLVILVRRVSSTGSPAAVFLHGWTKSCLEQRRNGTGMPFTRAPCRFTNRLTREPCGPNKEAIRFME